MSAPFFRLPRVTWTFCIWLSVSSAFTTTVYTIRYRNYVTFKKHRQNIRRKCTMVAALYRNPTFPTRTTKSNKLKRRENLEFETNRYFFPILSVEEVCGKQMGRWNIERFPDINFSFSSGFT